MVYQNLVPAVKCDGVTIKAYNWFADQLKQQWIKNY